MPRIVSLSVAAVAATLAIAAPAGAASAPPRCAHDGSSLVGPPTIADTSGSRLVGAPIVAEARHKRHRRHHKKHHAKQHPCLPASGR